MFFRKIAAIVAICLYFPTSIIGGIGLNLCPTMGKPVTKAMVCCCETSKRVTGESVYGAAFNKQRSCCKTPIILSLSAALLSNENNLKCFKHLNSSICENLFNSYIDLLNSKDNTLFFNSLLSYKQSQRIFLLDSVFRC